VKRLAGVEGVTEAADRIAGKRLGQIRPALGEVTADQRRTFPISSARQRSLHDAKIRVHSEDPNGEFRRADECDFAGAQTFLGTFEAGNVGDCRDEPDDFALLGFWLVAAMHELRLANLVRHFDFELDRVAGEAPPT